jgi:hypothetical protein
VAPEATVNGERRHEQDDPHLNARERDERSDEDGEASQ